MKVKKEIEMDAGKIALILVFALAVGFVVVSLLTMLADSYCFDHC